MEKTVNEPALPPNMEAQLRALLAALEASSQGDFSHRLPTNGIHPLLDRLAEAFNTSVSRSAASKLELARVARYSSEYLANMSYELRSPLNAVLILARLLSDNKDGNLSTRQVQYAKTIYDRGEELLTLIDDILDLSKAKAGQTLVDPRDFELSDLNALMERSFRPVATKKNLAFTLELAPNAPRSIRTDPQRLQRILMNLLSNAFKFTAQGGVKVVVKPAEKTLRFGLEALLKAERVIALAVTDTGIGIPKDKQKHILEPFQQADGSTARKYGGAGLGLSIARELVTLLGGELHVQSEPGHGSTFTVYLPESYLPPANTLLSEGDDEAPASGDTAIQDVSNPPSALSAGAYEETLEEPPSDSLAGRKVLLMDGDPRNMFLMNSLLERVQMKVEFAETGEEGLEILRATPDMDAVLMEVVLPEMDGYQTLRAIRQDRRFDRLPVIALTARAEKGTREKCLAAGASDYLSKPVDVDMLLEMLRRLCR
jgi:hypothetical protein